MGESLRVSEGDARRAFERMSEVVGPMSGLTDVQRPVTPVAPVNGARGYGRLFFNLRGLLGGGLAQAARQVGASPMVLRALEAEDVAQFPAWPEVVRIARRYGELTGVDMHATLRVMELDYALWQAHQQRAKSVAHSQVVTVERQEIVRLQSAISLKLSAILDGLKQFYARISFDGHRLTAIIAVLLIMAGFVAQASALQSSFASLEPRLSGLARGASAFLSHTLGSSEGELRWVNVDDPRSRRSDRLVPASYRAR